MSGVNNFEVFNEDYQNLTSDINYSANTARQGGLVDGIADTLLHNKLYRQTSVMTAALAAAMAAKEIDMLDSSLANLIISLGNLQIESEVDAKIAAAALNVSAFMLTVLDDATASAALTTLGVSTFIKLLLDDADAAAARITLGVENFLSLATTGYYMYPGGLIVQWGITGSIAGNGGSSGTITFPIAFPSLAVFCTMIGTAPATVGNNTNLTLATLTATNFSFLNSYINTMIFVWFAVGY